jgi:hypothetical protein
MVKETDSLGTKCKMWEAADQIMVGIKDPMQ